MNRVAFRYIDCRDWQGGYNYLLNLCKSLQQYAGDSVQPVVFCSSDIPDDDIEPFRQALGENLVVSDPMAKSAVRKRVFKTLVTGRDNISLKIFRDNRIDIVFENADFYGRSFPIPAISWIPDFQHRHLRQMFSTRQYWQREFGFRAQFRAGRAIMVSSQDAKNDCLKFYNLPESQIHVVRFGVPFIAEPDANERTETIKKYELPTSFFYLPNQFWKHKNHERVVDALSILKKEGKNIVVAASGGASNPTCVEVLENIQRKVTSLGLESNFRLLGRIPYSDLLCLLTGAKAVLNPSQFEGWSTPIEEAKAFGVNLVLSRLPVHVEQVGEQGIFFDPLNTREIADALLRADEQLEANRPPEADLIKRSETRMREFSNQFTVLAKSLRAVA